MTPTNVTLCALVGKAISAILPSTLISRTNIKVKTHLISKSPFPGESAPVFPSTEMMLIVTMINILALLMKHLPASSVPLGGIWSRSSLTIQSKIFSKFTLKN